MAGRIVQGLIFDAFIYAYFLKATKDGGLRDQQINNREIDDAVKNSIVSLSFYQSNTINKEVIANDDPSAYNPPFFKRLGIAIENGWDSFICLIIGIANLWVFVLAGIGALLLIRYYKIRKIISPVKIQ